MEFLNQTIENIFIQFEAAMNGELAQAEYINDFMVPVELPEINTQEINDIDFEITNGDYTAIDNNISNIIAIAHQCPYAGGNAVYRARVMLNMVNNYQVYNDELACLQVGIFRETDSGKASQKPEIKVYPNPANTTIFIDFIEPLKEHTQINILNAIGDLVLSNKVTEKAKLYSLDISKLTPGYYQLQVNNKTFNTSLKLVIIR